jgi:outer membrane protein assembly factor BamE (lipoprotein component of BamABCDE complex)
MARAVPLLEPRRLALALAALLLALAGCRSPAPEPEAEQLTVGTVQREIRVGMSAAEVAEALGTPNIVTTDEERREVWIYDRVSSDRISTRSSAFGTLLIVGADTAESSSSSRQRTMTIIIKYDADKKVRDFAYNYTQF